MKKGKTSQAVALAAALLGTTFLITSTEAQARRYDGAKNQGSYEPRKTFKKKAIKKKTAISRKAKKNRHHAYNRRYVRQQHARSQSASRTRMVINTRHTSRSPVVEKVQHRQCGIFEFAQDCANDVRIHDSYDITQPNRVSIAPHGYSQAVASSRSGGWGRTNHMKKAASMVGLHARTNRSDLKKIFTTSLNKPVDPVRTPWCAAWANAVLQSSGIQGTNSLLARSFLGWGASTSAPKEGDVVVMTRGRNRVSGHVGFFVEKQIINGRSYVKVLGGNQGKQVSEIWYPESRVLGYRRAG